MANRKEIRNSTAEFLIFQIEGKEQGVEVYYKDKTVWCTQKAMGMLFDCSTDNIGLHLKNIFASGELEKDSVTEKISATASDGKKYMTQFYNLDAVISVGYRVNSIRATQFRQWATSVLRELLYVDMFWIRKEWRMVRSLAKIILSICWLRLGRFDYRNVDSTKN